MPGPVMASCPAGCFLVAGHPCGAYPATSPTAEPVLQLSVALCRSVASQWQNQLQGIVSSIQQHTAGASNLTGSVATDLADQVSAELFGRRLLQLITAHGIASRYQELKPVKDSFTAVCRRLLQQGSASATEAEAAGGVESAVPESGEGAGQDEVAVDDPLGLWLVEQGLAWGPDSEGAGQAEVAADDPLSLWLEDHDLAWADSPVGVWGDDAAAGAAASGGPLAEVHVQSRFYSVVLVGQQLVDQTLALLQGAVDAALQFPSLVGAGIEGTPDSPAGTGDSVPQVAAGPFVDAAVEASQDIPAEGDVAGVAPIEDVTVEIGRASCRERVYVLV